MRLLCVLALVVVAGCGDGTGGQQANPAPRVHLVELATATVGTLAYASDRAGSLRALREVRLVNQEEGEIIEVGVREADRVATGDVLVRYDERILRAELDKALATLRQAELDHRRSLQLQERGFVGADALSRASTAREIAGAEVRLLRERLRHLTIRAPFAGVVSMRLVEPGSVTPRHTHLLTLIDLSTLVTDVNVSELVLPYLSVGDTAGVRIDALGDTSYAGRIVRIHPSIDPLTRTGRVEVALDPVPDGARPGQFCRVEIATGSRDHVLVPLAALRRDKAGEHVLIYDEGVVRRAAVVTGLRLGDRVEIREGLAAGARVVTKGFIGLEAGQVVQPVGPDEV